MRYDYAICCFKQKTAYEMRIRDWSSDVCSSDLDVVRHMRHVGSEKIDGTDHFNQIAERLIIAHSNHSIRVERRKIMTHRGHSQPWQYSTRYLCASAAWLEKDAPP